MLLKQVERRWWILDAHLAGILGSDTDDSETESSSLVSLTASSSCLDHQKLVLLDNLHTSFLHAELLCITNILLICNVEFVRH